MEFEHSTLQTVVLNSEIVVDEEIMDLVAEHLGQFPLVRPLTVINLKSNLEIERINGLPNSDDTERRYYSLRP